MKDMPNSAIIYGTGIRASKLKYDITVSLAEKIISTQFKGLVQGKTLPRLIISTIGSE